MKDNIFIIIHFKKEKQHLVLWCTYSKEMFTLQNEFQKVGGSVVAIIKSSVNR